MLVVTRKLEESIVIGNEIEVVVLRIDRNAVRTARRYSRRSARPTSQRPPAARSKWAPCRNSSAPSRKPPTAKRLLRKRKTSHQ